MYASTLSSTASYSTDLSIDAMDVSGEHHLDVLHSVFKTRMSPEGVPITDDTQQYELGASEEGEEEAKQEDENKEKELVKKEEGECGRCGVADMMWDDLPLSSSVAMELKLLSCHAVTRAMMCEKRTDSRVGPLITLKASSNAFQKVSRTS